MGSRSYFHYADVITVGSNGLYVGLDPLCTIKSHGRSDGGWAVELNVRQPAAADRALASEAGKLLTLPPAVLNRTGSGSTFRLPLRREAKGGLGPVMHAERAEALLTKWSAALADGRLLLFLSSVTRVALWRWPHGAVAPTLVGRICKQLLSGQQCPRLPSTLPEAACDTYGALAAYLDGLSDAQRTALSARHTSRARTSFEIGDGSAPSTTTWLVAQRFDASSVPLRQARAAGCDAVPLVGVCIPLSSDPTATDAAGGPIEIRTLSLASLLACLWRTTLLCQG
jgi:hypothetical protein